MILRKTEKFQDVHHVMHLCNQHKMISTLNVGSENYKQREFGLMHTRGSIFYIEFM